jgi:hypothetical protein
MPLTNTELALLESTYAAFSKAPRPTPDDITPHRCSECDDIRNRLSQYSVRDVPDEEMVWLVEAMPLLSPRALRYFLPRFVEFSLTHPDSIARDNVLYHLSAEHPNEPYWVERYAVFSSEERHAIANYLALRYTWPDAEFEKEHLERAMGLWHTEAQHHVPEDRY